MFLNNGVQIDELFGQLTKSGSAVVKTVTIRCLDGYELSCDSVSNLTVEAKHDSDGSYTDIENEGYDVSSLAGTDADFQLRFTPTSTGGVFSFRFIYGPPATNLAENVVFNSLGVRFGLLVTFNPIYPQFLGEGITFLSETVTFGD